MKKLDWSLYRKFSTPQLLVFLVSLAVTEPGPYFYVAHIGLNMLFLLIVLLIAYFNDFGSDEISKG